MQRSMRVLYSIYWFLTYFIYGTRVHVGRHAKFKFGGSIKGGGIFILEMISLLEKIFCLAVIQ